MTCIRCGGRHRFKRTSILQSDMLERKDIVINVIECEKCGDLILFDKANKSIRRPQHNRPTMKDLKKIPLKTTSQEEKWYKEHKLNDKELVAYAKGCKEGKWKSFEKLQKGVKNE